MSAVQRLHAAVARARSSSCSARRPTRRRADVQRLVEVLVARLSASLARAASRRRGSTPSSPSTAPARFATPFRWSARAARRPLGTGALRRRRGRDVAATCSTPRARRWTRSCDRARARARAARRARDVARRRARARCARCARWRRPRGHGAVPPRRRRRQRDRVAVGIPDAWFDVPGRRMTLHGPARRRPGAPPDRDARPAPAPRRRAGRAGGRRPARRRARRGDARPPAPRRGLAPARVIGAWPDAGCVLVVELDDEHARQAARTVVACAAAVSSPAQARRVTRRLPVAA